MHAIHIKYGNIIRIAPDELSFADQAAFNDIYGDRSGHRKFDKNPNYYHPPPGQVHSIVTIPKDTDHARMRKVLDPAFTEKALNSQASIIEAYVEILITRLREFATAPGNKGKSTIIEIVKWFNYFAFDVSTDLTYGETSGCLVHDSYLEWADTTADYVRCIVLSASARYLPLLNRFSKTLVPRQITKRQYTHRQLSKLRMDRRLNLEHQRPDFITHLLPKIDQPKGISMSELESSLTVFHFGGSDAPSTVLSGIINFLVQSPAALQDLVVEIRDAFEKESDISITTVKDLPILNATISEGLRLSNPVPSGLPRLVPLGGDTVAAEWIPENVSTPQSCSHLLI